MSVVYNPCFAPTASSRWGALTGADFEYLWKNESWGKL